nr:hypothetical protein [Acetobacter persici]
MLDWLRPIAGDPIYGNLFLSPIMGVVFSLLLMPPPPKDPKSGSRKIIEINYEKVDKIVHDNRQFHTHYHGTTSNQDDGAFALIAASALFCILTVYLYLHYGSIALSVMQGCAIFSITATVVTAARGYWSRIYSGSSWAIRLMLPIINAGIVLYYLPDEKRYLNDIISQIGSVKIIDLFFHNQYAFRWVFTQSIGVLTGIIALVLGLLMLCHYIAVSAFAVNDRKWSYKFSKATEFLGSWFVVPILGILLFAHWYALSGKLYYVMNPPAQ